METSSPAPDPAVQDVVTNRVLKLDGDGDYVELPADAFLDLDTVTVEAWVKWDRFQWMSRVCDFAITDGLLNLHNRGESPDLWSEWFRSGNLDSRQLTGNEAGLVALWNFDDGTARDATGQGHDGILMGEALVVEGEPALSETAAVWTPEPSGAPREALTGQVLHLDGDGSYVELPSNIFNNLTEATVEGWVKWDRLGSYSRFFDFGNTWRAIEVSNMGTQSTLYLTIGRPPWDQASELRMVAPGWIRTNAWCHLAVTTGPAGVRLYANGALVASNAFTGSFAAVTNGDHNYIGRSNWENDAYFEGEMDEVRVWSVQRTVEEIRDAMFRDLTGREQGLMALWDFEDGAARDATGHGHDGILMGNAFTVEAERALPAPAAGGQTTSATGQVLDLDGRSGYVALPSDILAGLDQATIEGWFKSGAVQGQWKGYMVFGTGENRVILETSDRDNELSAQVEEQRTGRWIGSALRFSRDSEPNTWVHVAMVFTTNGLNVVVNGEPVGTERNALLSRVKGFRDNFLGSDEIQGSFMAGQMDEVRIWRTARTVDQIRGNMMKSLTGKEEGLLSLWNFDEATNRVVRDAGPGGFDGRLVGGAHLVESDRPALVWSEVSGHLLSAEGNPLPGASVVLTKADGTQRTSSTDMLGRFAFTRLQPDQAFRLSARVGWESAVLPDVILQPDEHRVLDVHLVALASVSGHVHDAAGAPVAGVLLHLVSADGSVTGRTAAVSFSGKDGAYRFLRVEPGEYRLGAQDADGFSGYQDGGEFEVAPEAQMADFDFTVAPASPMPHLSSSPANRVLLTSNGRGAGGYVVLPPDIFDNLEEATVEGWVRWGQLAQNRAFYSYGRQESSLRIRNPGDSHDLQAAMHHAGSVSVSDMLRSNEWCHVAWVTGPNGMRLYFNGGLVARNTDSGSFSSLNSGAFHYLGADVYGGRSGVARLNGALDEVRVWAEERSGEQILTNMFRRLTGRETGLAALWNFDDPDHPGRDATAHGFDGQLRDGAVSQAADLPGPDAVRFHLAVTGAVRDKDGRAVGNADVTCTALQAETGRELASKQVQTDYAGTFVILDKEDLPTSPDWRLVISARKDELTYPATELPSTGKENLTLVLRDRANLSGRVLALDDRPLPSVVVQAVPWKKDRVPGATAEPGLQADLFDLHVEGAFPTVPEGRLPTLRRVDATIDFSFRRSSVAPPEFGGSFYCRWSGSLSIDTSRDYSFSLRAKNQARLFIDGSLIAQSQFQGGLNGSDFSGSEGLGTVALSAGPHAVTVECYNAAGRDACRLFWSADDLPREIVPARVLFHVPSVTTTLTDPRGRFRYIDLPPGEYTLRAHVPGGFALPDVPDPVAIVRDEPVTGVDFHLSPFKKGRWEHWTHAEGLPDDGSAPCCRTTREPCGLPPSAAWPGSTARRSAHGPPGTACPTPR